MRTAAGALCLERVCVCVCVCLCLCVCVCVCVCVCTTVFVVCASIASMYTVSRIGKIIGLFCRMSSV